MSPRSPTSDRPRRLYVVATVHLDTQWRWTVQDTIARFIPNTLKRNFELFRDHRFFVLSFEGAFRYMLMKEYYPEDYEELKRWIAEGRWRVAGSMLDSPDVNTVSPESLIRHILYGNRFFSTEFDRRSEDLFLPDCFGFGAVVPSVAAHCGLLGFSAQKFGNWMSPASIPFEVGVWRGPDGLGVVAAIRPEGYGEGLDEDLSQAERYVERIDETGDQSGVYVGMKYVGVGDRGGGLDDASIGWLERSVDGKGPITVELSGSDQLFRDLSPQQVARLPTYQGELLLPRHGTGCLTSQAVLKRWNRQNELLAESAEKAATIADHLGALPYPKERFQEAWVRFLWHQMHDDLTGTSIPAAYDFSFNDELLSLNQFSHLLTDSIGAIAGGLDTQVVGLPIVVFNPLSIEREDLVEVGLEEVMPVPSSVTVHARDGTSVPAQISNNLYGERVLVFLARVPALGVGVFDVHFDSDEGLESETLEISDHSIENHRYRVEVDQEGDVSSVFDKAVGKELLASPIRLELLLDRSARWPAWEILYDDLQAQPCEVVDGPAEIEVIEEGAARVALRIRRRKKRSTFVQTVRLSAGDAGNRVEIHTAIDWQTRNRLLKSAFRLTTSNPEASYDLGLGQIRRPNSCPEKYEVPAQQWVDLTRPDGSLGVSILNDCKYGWDKPDDQTLRLSLLRSPRVLRKFRHQGRQDLGTHRCSLALYGHGSDWRPSMSCWQAARLNQRLLAFQTSRHPGPLGREISFMSSSTDQILIRTLKQAESDSRAVIRVQELDGAATGRSALTSSSPIEAAELVDGQERPIGPAELSDGSLIMELEPFAVRAFASNLEKPTLLLSPPCGQPVQIAYDCRASTPQGEASQLGFDGKGHSYPAELFPSRLTQAGVVFELGPVGSQQPNALVCRGQIVELPQHSWGRVHCLLASANGTRRAVLKAGHHQLEFELPHFSGLLGRWNRNAEITEPEDSDGGIHGHRVAWVATHRHGPNGEDQPYVFCYLFEISMQIEPGCTELRLPDDESIRVFGISLGDGRIAQTIPASRIYD